MKNKANVKVRKELARERRNRKIARAVKRSMA